MPCLTCLELNSSLEVVSKPDMVNGLSTAGNRNRAQQKQEKKDRIEALLRKHQSVCPDKPKVEELEFNQTP